MSAQLREVAERLWDGGTLQCRLTAETVDDEKGDGVIRVTVDIYPEGQTELDALSALELLYELRYLADLSQLRDLASRYDIPAEKLEALLPKERP